MRVTKVASALRVSLASTLIIIVFALGISLNLFLTRTAISSNNHRLCTIIQLVTASPVPYPSDPAKNPSRVQAYRFYRAFLDVKREYGC